MSTSDELASAAASASVENLPESVTDAARVAIDASLVAIEQHRADQLVGRILDVYAAPSASRVGDPRGVIAVMAQAMASGSAIRLGLDGRGVALSASVIVPAAVLAAASADCSGAELVAAVGIGLETAAWVEEVLAPGFERRGWDPVGVSGRVGGAVAAGRALRCGAEEIRNALGFAATTAAGFQLGGPELLAFSAGKATADALEAATLAKGGLIGPPLPLEGRRGLFVLVGNLAPQDALAVSCDVGTYWRTADTGQRARTRDGLAAAGGSLGVSDVRSLRDRMVGSFARS